MKMTEDEFRMRSLALLTEFAANKGLGAMANIVSGMIATALFKAQEDEADAMAWLLSEFQRNFGYVGDRRTLH